MRRIHFVLCWSLCLVACCSSSAQQPSTASTIIVPHLIRFAGMLSDPSGRPLTGIAGITFSFYQDQEGGAPLWMETQNVALDASGRYEVLLGAEHAEGVPMDVFTSGEARWLGAQVQGQTEEQPRVLLVSVPYALKAADAETLGGKPLSAFQLALPSSNPNHSPRSTQALQPATEQANEIRCTGSTGCISGFIPKFATNGGSATVSNSIVSQSGSKLSVAGAVSAKSGSFSLAADANSVALSAFETGTTKVNVGVWGSSASPVGFGVYGTDGRGSSFHESGAGVWGDASNGVGVIGTSDADIGVQGSSQQFTGVVGLSQNGNGISGQANTTGAGVVAENMGEGNAFFGNNGSSGTPSDSNATMTLSNGSSVPEFVIYAENGFGSAYVRTDTNGNLAATGSLFAAAKPFKIDHPLDPANKYLLHTAIESPDMKNIYDGVAALNANGEATVELPSYFEALNRDFRYQLTAIGAPGPNLYVAEEISGNRFRIAGGKPGAKVSWQITGIRHDAWANANRIPVEVEKTGAERGRYLHPQAFGLGPEQSVSYNRGVDSRRVEDLKSLRRKSLPAN